MLPGRKTQGLQLPLGQIVLLSDQRIVASCEQCVTVEKISLMLKVWSFFFSVEEFKAVIIICRVHFVLLTTEADISPS